MRRLALISILFLALPGRTCEAQARYGGIQLLDGYSLKQGWAVDADAWAIEGKGGFKIQFEAGTSEGSWADPKEKNKYSWYREKRIHGCQVRFAVVKPGLTTQWEPGDDRHLTPGNILLVTFLLGGEKSDYTADFSAKFASSEELADALLMVVTFDPRKANL